MLGGMLKGGGSGKAKIISADDGNDNIKLGEGSMLLVNSDDIDNIAIGKDVMTGDATSTTVRRNIGIGNNTLENALAAEGNVAIGKDALNATTVGSSNVAIGFGAAKLNQSGGSNFALGKSALYSNVQGSSNVAIGKESLQYFIADTSNHGNNTAIGVDSGKFISTGTENTCIGQDSCQGIDGTRLEGDRNTCIGYSSGLLLQGAAHSNTLIGAQVADNITTGTNNVMLGHHISASAADVTYEIVIGSGVDESNDFDGGGTETCRIGRASDYITVDFGENANWSHSSDARIKKDISDNELGLAFINDLRTVNYKKKAPSEYPK